MSPKSAKTTLQTVERALAILEYVASEPRGLSVKEIAQALHLNISICYHLTNTLIAQNYLIKGDDRRLSMGPKIAALYQAFRRNANPGRDFLPILQGLMHETRETAYLAAWDHGEVVLQALVEGRETLRVAGLHVGLRGPAHARASGKVVLAYLPEDELDAFLRRHPLTAVTGNTITDPAQLRRALADIAKAGYALDNQEFAEGVCCLAVPYFGPEGAVEGAVTVSAPVTRFFGAEPRIHEAVLRAGETISRLYGYEGPYPRHVTRA